MSCRLHQQQREAGLVVGLAFVITSAVALSTAVRRISFFAEPALQPAEMVSKFRAVSPFFPAELTVPLEKVTGARQAPSFNPTASALESLAARDHSAALVLALAESATGVRDELLQGVLRGWAVSEPKAAASWARSQTSLDQGLAMAAVFNGANKNPEEAVRLATQLSAEDPANSVSYGGYLIAALSHVAKFELAADFAAHCTTELRTELLTAAYNNWAERQPEDAILSSLKLADPAAQDAAFHATVGGWARTDPAELTVVAAKLPLGADRNLALISGLRSWIVKDPEEAADWIAKNKLTAHESEMVLEE